MRVMEEYVKNEADSVLKLPRFIAELSCSDVDFFKLLNFIETMELCKKLHGFYLRLRNDVIAVRNANVEQPKSGVNKLLSSFKSRSAARATNTDHSGDNELAGLKEYWKQNDAQISSPLYAVKQFLEAITTNAEDAIITVEHGKDDRFDCKFRFLLLNPAEKLRDVVNESRSLVLIGGTMKPLDQLMDAFQRVCQVDTNKIVNYSCGHVIDKKQLMALTVARGPNGQVLNLVHENRTKPEVINAIALTFVNILRHVPNGAVVFFPSYDYLDIFVKRIRITKVHETIEKVKPIVCESRTEDVWTKFCKLAVMPKGAVLFAVVGGKLSEGINFGDELGRCVLMVGLPYANRRSVELQERMRYVEDKVGNGAGAKFYSSLCAQSVNQAIGRVIRHRNDYAAIILLDSRYSQPNIVATLPSWVVDSLSHADTFPKTISSVVSFFRNVRAEREEHK
jgi:chromosome transmission fidelity protein 1